jgi:carbamoyl-phosphate synthase large subunit
MVVRERIQVESGLSVKARVVDDPEIETLARSILDRMTCFGPVNLQCFRTTQGVRFTEVNPRIAGGLSLSMAATGNWFLWLKAILAGQEPEPVTVRLGLVMMRCFRDVIVPEADLLGRRP